MTIGLLPTYPSAPNAWTYGLHRRDDLEYLFAFLLDELVCQRSGVDDGGEAVLRRRTGCGPRILPVSTVD